MVNCGQISFLTSPSVPLVTKKFTSGSTEVIYSVVGRCRSSLAFFGLCLASLFLSLSLSLSHTHTHKHSLTHTLSLSISLSLQFYDTGTFSQEQSCNSFIIMSCPSYAKQLQFFYCKFFQNVSFLLGPLKKAKSQRFD